MHSDGILIFGNSVVAQMKSVSSYRVDVMMRWNQVGVPGIVLGRQTLAR